MAERAHDSEWQFEQILGNLLRAGVILAAAVVLAGGTLYLIRHGREPQGLHVFQGEPAALRSLEGIVSSALRLRARAIIQLGMLVLIATPVVRVALSVIAFLLERDWTYVVLTWVVLAVLLYSLFFVRL
jgi:uncharacterized membrane protein